EVILAIVVLNAGLGFFEDHRAEQALAAVGAIHTQPFRVRGGAPRHEGSAEQQVPGDGVLLGAGKRERAEGRRLEAVSLQVGEGALSGGAQAVEKTGDVMEDTSPPPAVADRHNLAYMGTAVTFGRGVLVVAHTGLITQLGNIAAML